jgi:hypothetical protein
MTTVIINSLLHFDRTELAHNPVNNSGFNISADSSFAYCVCENYKCSFMKKIITNSAIGPYESGND